MPKGVPHNEIQQQPVALSKAHHLYGALRATSSTCFALQHVDEPMAMHRERCTEVQKVTRCTEGMLTDCRALVVGGGLWQQPSRQALHRPRPACPRCVHAVCASRVHPVPMSHALAVPFCDNHLCTVVHNTRTPSNRTVLPADAARTYVSRCL